MDSEIPETTETQKKRPGNAKMKSGKETAGTNLEGD
jgi:hypothetical protein